jgi:hypothetical protein
LLAGCPKDVRRSCGKTGREDIQVSEGKSRDELARIKMYYYYYYYYYYYSLGFHVMNVLVGAL